ncbi:MAG TPA: hypothetical protein VMI94_06180 [Bryobacteraceae bacterium]|nr:hypothetical protein [Bryobacteraceae bacterium]
MDDTPDLLRLPPGIDSPDPVDGNPFPDGDVRHGFWDRATHEAEEEMCRLNDALARARPNTPQEALPLDMAYFLGKYDVWARRGVRVVLAEVMIAPWDQWLANYANETLKTFKKLSPPDAALEKLRDALIGRREYWKAEGRRNVTFQLAHQAQLAASKSEVGVSKATAQWKPFQETQGELRNPAPTSLETASAQPSPASGASADSVRDTDRRALVDAFLLQCNREPDLDEKVIRRHIWRAVGHKHPRQFQHWQAQDSRATESDYQNFGRILSMNPADFVTLLKRIGLILTKP